MPHLARHLALAACVALIGSVADAAPRKVAKEKLRHEAARAVDRTIEMEADEDEDVSEDDDSSDDAAVEEEEEAEPVRKRRKASKR